MGPPAGRRADAGHSVSGRCGPERGWAPCGSHPPLLCAVKGGCTGTPTGSGCIAGVARQVGVRLADRARAWPDQTLAVGVGGIVQHRTPTLTGATEQLQLLRPCAHAPCPLPRARWDLAGEPQGPLRPRPPSHPGLPGRTSLYRTYERRPTMLACTISTPATKPKPCTPSTAPPTSQTSSASPSAPSADGHSPKAGNTE